MHSEAAIRKRRITPALIVPSLALILRRGRAMIDVVSNPCARFNCVTAFGIYPILNFGPELTTPVSHELISSGRKDICG